MIALTQMRATRPMTIAAGIISTTTEVWAMLSACKQGDLTRVRELTNARPALVGARYDYTAPLHLAVREGHLDVAEFLIDQGAFDPNYKTHPFLEPLTVVAADRDLRAMSALLSGARVHQAAYQWEDTGSIDAGADDTQRVFQERVDQGQYADVEAMLKERPDLALDELAFWGEGILSVPANGNDRRMVELLMQFGARVPDLSKWGERYYFKHDVMTEFLLACGANPNHMNWQHITVLHDKAFRGDVRKVQLLLDHGADIDAIDEEFQSTPLGVAARWGRRDVVRVLLAGGADPNRSGAPWAMPLAWAVKKGHLEVASDLRDAGAWQR